MKVAYIICVYLVLVHLLLAAHLKKILHIYILRDADLINATNTTETISHLQLWLPDVRTSFSIIQSSIPGTIPTYHRHLSVLTIAFVLVKAGT